MSKDLDRIITEIETLTARMLATDCWEQGGEFGALSATRRALAALLIDRTDLDANAAERIRRVVLAGNSLVARTLAMRKSVADAMAETERQQRLTREMGCRVVGQAQKHRVDIAV